MNMQTSDRLLSGSAAAVPAAVLTGQTEQHLCASSDAASLGAPVHRDVVAPFHRLHEEARQAGFDLRILSGFRSFDQQLAIWNGKATGKRAVLDGAAVPLDIARLSERELVFAILRWSALPGASRHHWGTDLDVYDSAARPAGYEIELIPEEVDAGGMFGPLHEWLDARIAAGASFGFARPYDVDRGGVAPERWHLSHAPVATACLRQLTPELLRATVARADLMLKHVVLQHLDEIYQRFVVNTSRTFT
jgi:LAS superfamily LD-carboxypeptidase LdcB